MRAQLIFTDLADPKKFILDFAEMIGEEVGKFTTVDDGRNDAILPIDITESGFDMVDSITTLLALAQVATEKFGGRLAHIQIGDDAYVTPWEKQEGEVNATEKEEESGTGDV